MRVLARHPDRLGEDWRASVEVVEGDADTLQRALEGVEVAYYLVHSMESGGDFRARDRDLADAFAGAAKAASVRRIVYLSGLHPDEELSEHMASRVEVGERLLASGVPTAVLQAGIVLGTARPRSTCCAISLSGSRSPSDRSGCVTGSSPSRCVTSCTTWSAPPISTRR